MEKTITLTEDEVLGVLVALSGELRSLNEHRAVCATLPEKVERLNWYDERIKRLENIRQKLRRAT